MAQRGIREYDGKKMLANHWQDYFSKEFNYPGKVVLVTPDTKLDSLPKKYSWLNKEKLVVKPDQLFGKRGKHGLIKANASFNDIKKWIKDSNRFDMIYHNNLVNKEHFHQYFVIDPTLGIFVDILRLCGQ